ncbi:BCCT family transporter [Vibrio metschnikovii]
MFAVSGLSNHYFCIYDFDFPRASRTCLLHMRGWLTSHLDWFCHVIGQYLCLGVFRLGGIAIRPSAYWWYFDAVPGLFYAGWLAMLFAAGMGIGLVFFGVSEPVTLLVVPYQAQP